MKYPEGKFSEVLSAIRSLCETAYNIQYWANENLSSEVRKLVKDAIFYFNDAIFYFNVAHVHYRHNSGEVAVIVENYKKGIELVDECCWLVGSIERKAPPVLINVLTALNTIARDNLIYVERL